MVKDRDAWWAAVQGVIKSWTQLNDGTTTLAAGKKILEGPQPSTLGLLLALRKLPFQANQLHDSPLVLQLT